MNYNTNMFQAVSLMEKAPTLIQELLTFFNDITEFDDTLTLNGDRLSDLASDDEALQELTAKIGGHAEFFKRVFTALSLLIDIEEQICVREERTDVMVNAMIKKYPELYKAQRDSMIEDFKS